MKLLYFLQLERLLPGNRNSVYQAVVDFFRWNKNLCSNTAISINFIKAGGSGAQDELENGIYQGYLDYYDSQPI